MTDSNMESIPEVGGQEEPISASSTAGGLSSSAIDVKAIAEALAPIIKEEVERRTQSIKDKRIAKIQSDLDEVLARYEELRAEGLSPTRARRELQLDQLLEAQLKNSSNVAPVQATTGNRPTQAVVDHTALLNNLGLDPNAPEVINVLRSTDDPAQQIVMFGQLAAQKKVKPQPNPAQQVPVGGGTSVSLTTEALMQKYREMTKDIPPGSAGIKARFEIQRQIRKMAEEAGVPSPV